MFENPYVIPYAVVATALWWIADRIHPVFGAIVMALALAGVIVLTLAGPPRRPVRVVHIAGEDDDPGDGGDGGEPLPPTPIAPDPGGVEVESPLYVADLLAGWADQPAPVDHPTPARPPLAAREAVEPIAEEVLFVAPAWTARRPRWTALLLGLAWLVAPLARVLSRALVVLTYGGIGLLALLALTGRLPTVPDGGISPWPVAGLGLSLLAGMWVTAHLLTSRAKRRDAERIARARLADRNARTILLSEPPSSCWYDADVEQADL
jgi:hypothetical protein